MATVERHDLHALHAVISVSIPKEDYLPKLQEDLRKTRQKAQMKGFRPGQVPMGVIKKMYGQSVLLESLNELTNKHLYGYIQEHKINTLFQPIPVETETRYRFDLNAPEDFEFKFDVGLAPEFELKGLSKDDIYEQNALADLDEMAEKELEIVRRRQAKRVNPTDNIFEEDIVKIAARELEADGSPKVDGLETTMTTFVKNIPSESLRALLLTKKTGDSLQFNPHELDNFKSEKMYRKYMLELNDSDERAVNDFFEGTVSEVSRLELPEINQEFYDGFFGPGQVTNTEEAMQRMRESAGRHYETQSEGLLMRDFQERLLAENEFELPEIFLKRWLKTQTKQKTTEEQIDQFWPTYAGQIRWSLIRERLQKEIDFEITEAEIRAEFGRRIARYFGGNLEMMPPGILESTVNKLMADEKQVQEVEEEIEFNQLFNGIKERVTVVKKPIPSAEFNAMLAEIDARRKAQNGDDED